jgi:tRNA (cytidine/uridine-2'-O-)-methyltransferase
LGYNVQPESAIRQYVAQAVEAVRQIRPQTEPHMVQLALFEPDIPQNAGTLLRLGACLDIAVHMIEPAGFALSDKAFVRAGMDYAERATMIRHQSWADFLCDRPPGRLVLLTTRADQSHIAFDFRPTDCLLLGRESAGVPEQVHSRADARIAIPMAGQARALNVAVACAMVLGEALRQTGGFPTSSQ